MCEVLERTNVMKCTYIHKERESSFYGKNELHVTTMKMQLKVIDTTLDYERVCLFELNLNKSLSLTPHLTRRQIIF
jgi:hypothetical protein